MEARTATGGSRDRRPIAVAGLAPLALSLVASLLVPALNPPPAGADQSGPDQARVSALAAKIGTEAAHIHQLTEQLDQARLKVNTTSVRLVGVTRQHDTTMQGLAANRAVLLDQAVRAYMQGGVAPSMMSVAGSVDLTVGREYLRVASGDLVDTGDQLRQLEASLRADQILLRGAQQANLQALGQLQSLRTTALAVAASEQVKLDNLQTQLAAQVKVAAITNPSFRSGPTTQGLPVNNGLVAVVQAAGTTAAVSAPGPAAPPVTAAPTPVAPTASGSGTGAGTGAGGGGGGHAGGVWLSLRRCESSDNYAENTGNGYYGAYQFSQGTWSGLGFPGRPDLASPAMQDEAAMKLQAQSGWGQWPACSAALGLA